MIQDINPKKYNPDFNINMPVETDYIICQRNKEILVKKVGEDKCIPTFGDTLSDKEAYKNSRFVRTIAIDDRAYYVTDKADIFDMSGFEFVGNEFLRNYMPQDEAFGALTALQISRWMKSNVFCGKCGHEMKPSDTERAMVCTSCNNMVFPKICPAVTISLIHKDKILLVRNKGGLFHRFAQIAGYVEIGETFEDTVAREAMEETGMAVKNIKYYKNQPWAMTDAQMIGYTAELDMDKMAEIYGKEILEEEYPAIRLQEEELLEGRWFSADEIPPDIATRSLTYEMIGNFRKKYIDKTENTNAYEAFYKSFDTGH